MAYPLSATKLKSYHSCPQAYYFKYERKLEDKGSFAQPELGKALHKALETFYRDWHYNELTPPRGWMLKCWEQTSQKLDPKNQAEGFNRLNLYYDRFILEPGLMKQPLGTEQSIKRTIQIGEIEFLLQGRYDRLDMKEGSLTLIDYKGGAPPTNPVDLDLQLGFYDWILEGIYQKSLQEWQLIYLKTGDSISYLVTEEHRDIIRQLIRNLAQSINGDDEWLPCRGDQCKSCNYKRFCSDWYPEPDPLPDDVAAPRPVQRTLSLLG